MNLRNKRQRLLAFAAAIALCFSAFSLPAGAAYADSAGETREKKVALTFDDGPHPRYTDTILQILEEYDVKATFFVIGSNVEYYPEVFRRTVAAGHEIGNHTYSHPHLAKLTSEEVLAEIGKCDRVLSETAGVSAKYFRPPEGCSAFCVKTATAESGHSPVLWTVDTRDWAGNDVASILKMIGDAKRDKEIILFHDYVSCENHTIPALRQAIPILKKLGYRFCTVSELGE